MEFFEEDELLNTSDVLYSNVLSHSISELAPSSLLTTVAVKNESVSSDFPHLFVGGTESIKEETMQQEIKEEMNTTTKTEESESEGEGDSEIEDDDEEMGEEDYERQRQENIKRNQQLLQQLGFSNGGLASQALEESQDHLADDDSLLQCVMCDKREGMVRKTLRGVAQTTFGRRYKPDITEENRAWFAEFFCVSPESLKLGPVCNYCYQHQYSLKQKDKTEKLRQENKMSLRTRKRADEQQDDSMVTPPTTPSKAKASPKQSRTPSKEHCTVCGRREGEASQTITGRSTIVSFKCTVNASNVERYTSFFNQQIEFGQICNVCYGDWYRTTYKSKKGSPRKKTSSSPKATTEKSPARGASAITQVKSPRVARPKSAPKKPGRPRKTETAAATPPKSSPRISKKRKHKK